MQEVYLATEGDDDLAVARRLLGHLRLTEALSPGAAGGKARLDEKLAAYAGASTHLSWLILRDLDRDAPCAAALVARLVPRRPERMLLRIAVRAVEAWLLADAQGIAQFLRVPIAKVPRNPDALDNPKLELVNLARRSSSREIKVDIVPEEGGGRPVGKAYSARITAFAGSRWDPDAARRSSTSLDRCLRALEKLASTAEER